VHWFANTQALFNSTPAVVTVYDLLSFWDTAKFSRLKRAYLRFMMQRTVHNAPVLLPMSLSTAHSLQNTLGALPDKMVVIPTIITSRFSVSPTSDVLALRNKYLLPSKFWLYVAHFYPHKNHIGLLQAYCGLREKGIDPWPLVLRGDDTGSGQTVRQAVQDLQLQNDVIFLPRLTSDEICALYSAATSLIFSSLYEGGGIPLLEAMACGCPILASDLEVIHESVGEAGSYFDPYNRESLMEAMIHFQSNGEIRQLKKAEGLRRIVAYRPEPIITKLLRAYERAASMK
jgi:glycosyltransferase involved in cell wall biosynthesis